MISHHGRTAVQLAVPKETLEQEGKHREQGDLPDSTLDRPVDTVKAIINHPSILEAATVGNLEMLQNLIRIGASISTQGDDGSTALHCAARAGHAEVVEYILNNGLNKNFKNEKGRTALDEAAIGGDMTTLEVLLNARVKVDMDDRRAKETIRRILRLRDAQLMKVLLDKLQIENDAEKAKRLLLNATVAGPITLVRYLLSYPGLAGNPRFKEVIFRRAAKYGWEDVIDFLLAHDNFNINASNGHSTALHLAAKFNHVGVVRRMLRQSECDINKMASGYTALHHAAKKGHEEVVKILLDHGGIDINLRTTSDWWTSPAKKTALDFARMQGHTDIVNLLLEQGAEDSAEIQSSFTPTNTNSEAERITPPGSLNSELNEQLGLYNLSPLNILNDAMEMSIRDPETPSYSFPDEDMEDMLWDDAEWERFASEQGDTGSL